MQRGLPDSREGRLARLQGRFRVITRPLERRERRRRWARAAADVVQPLAVTLAVTGAITGGSLAWWMTTLPPSWSLKDRLLHLAAAPNCAAARAAGLAPARRGEPGYFVRHDADDDGIACEPVPAGARPSDRSRRYWPILRR